MINKKTRDNSPSHLLLVGSYRSGSLSHLLPWARANWPTLPAFRSPFDKWRACTRKMVRPICVFSVTMQMLPVKQLPDNSYHFIDYDFEPNIAAIAYRSARQARLEKTRIAEALSDQKLLVTNRQIQDSILNFLCVDPRELIVLSDDARFLCSENVEIITK